MNCCTDKFQRNVDKIWIETDVTSDVLTKRRKAVNKWSGVAGFCFIIGCIA